MLVALVFAELASHYPVAGSIYQWSKRLSHRTLGWFTGWFYFWAQVMTVTAVAVIVALRRRRPGPATEGFLDSPAPIPGLTMFTFIALTTLVLTTLINAFGVRLLATLNNIGVGDRDPGHGRVRARCCCSSPTTSRRRSCSRRAGRRGPTTGTCWPRSCSACSCRSSSCTASTRPGQLRRGDDRREPPGAARRALVGLDLRARRRRLPARGHPVAPGHPGGHGRGLGGGFPIADDHQPEPDRGASPGSPSARSTVRHPRSRSSSARSPSRAPRPG